MSRFGEAVPYDATAVRPAYGALPAPVRERIEKELGGKPADVRVAGGGFTGGFAARLRSDSGAELFVKAAGPDLPHVLASYRQEAKINPALPEGVPAPRLHFSTEVDGWTVLGFEVVDGRAAKLPMTAADLDLMLRAWAEAAERLTPAPGALLDLGVADVPIDEKLHSFNTVVSGGTEPFPLPPALEGRIEELAEIESGVDEAMTADAVMHFDLRPDNVIIGSDRAWICDWNWLQVHSTWFDTVGLLNIAHGDGHDAERLFWEHPTAKGVTGEQLDAVLAAYTGYYLFQAQDDLIEGISPYIRKHQRWSGLSAADWLATRRGWQ